MIPLFAYRRVFPSHCGTRSIKRSVLVYLLQGNSQYGMQCTRDVVQQQNSTLAQGTRAIASSWHKDIFPAGRPASIVTPAPFHCQVRDGLEWFQCSKCTKKLLRLVYTFCSVIFADSKEKYNPQKVLPEILVKASQTQHMLLICLHSFCSVAVQPTKWM